MLSVAKNVPNRCNIRHHATSRLHRLAFSENDDDDRDCSSRLDGNLAAWIASMRIFTKRALSGR